MGNPRNPGWSLLAEMNNDEQKKPVPHRAEALSLSPQSPAFLKQLGTAVVLTVIALFYFYPHLAHALRFGSGTLPPIFEPDLYFYLNLISMYDLTDSTFMHPWYGIEVPGADISYSKFPFVMYAFKLVLLMAGGDLSIAVLLWHAMWLGLIALLFYLLLQKIMDKPKAPLLLAGFAMFFLLELSTLRETLSAFMSLPDLGGFQSVRLPFMRQFFPQVTIPLYLGYLLMQMQVFEGKGIRPWAMMLLLQSVALATFPYAMVLMFGTTTACLLASALQPGQRARVRVRGFMIYLGLSALIDVGYLFQGTLSDGHGVVSGAGGALRLMDFSFQRMAHLMGGSFFLLVLVCLAVLFVPDKKQSGAKITLLCAGAANGLLLLSDSVVNYSFYMTAHLSYYYHTTLACLLSYAVYRAYERFQGSRPARVLLIASLVLSIGVGAVSSLMTVKRNAQANADMALLGKELKTEALSRSDLVVAEHRIMEWVPLLADTNVLFFHRRGDYLLPTGKSNAIQADRMIAYLYFKGKTSKWIKQTLGPSGRKGKKTFLLRKDVLPLFAKEPGRIAELADQALLELLPLMASYENSSRARELLSSYQNIYVIDNAEKRVFLPERLEPYMSLESRRLVGGFLIEKYTPKDAYNQTS